MADTAAFPYETRLNILLWPLEVIDTNVPDAKNYKWFNQTLCKVQRLRRPRRHHRRRIPLAQARQRRRVLSTPSKASSSSTSKDKTVELKPGQGFVVPRGIVHRTRAPHAHRDPDGRKRRHHPHRELMSLAVRTSRSGEHRFHTRYTRMKTFLVVSLASLIAASSFARAQGTQGLPVSDPLYKTVAGLDTAAVSTHTTIASSTSSALWSPKTLSSTTTKPASPIGRQLFIDAIKNNICGKVYRSSFPVHSRCIRSRAMAPWRSAFTASPIPTILTISARQNSSRSGGTKMAHGK